MWTQFILENIHFAINLFAALVFFAISWLYLDSWLGRKTLKEGLKIAGFLLLSVSFLINSTFVESALLTSIIGRDIQGLLLAFTRIPGYVLIIASLIMDPLQSRPEQVKESKPLLSLSFPFVAIFSFLYPVLSALTGFLYLRRATLGFENHLKPVALAFFILSIFELLSVSANFRNTENIAIYNFVAPFGPLWLLEHAVLLLAGLVLGKWVFGYLLKRLQSQLFMIFTSVILVIFLLTTVTFTGLLLKNLQDETLTMLETDVKVLSLAVDSKKAESLSDAQVLAQNPAVIYAANQKDKKTLSDISQSYLLTKKQNFLVIVSDSGQVLARGEDKERIGDSLSDDSLVKRALLGENGSSVVTKDGVLGPEISLRSATPIKNGKDIVGAVMTGVTLDNAFVDGIKAATGLEAAIYGDNILSASTLVASDGKSRYIGIREEGKGIKEKVLQRGESYTGSVNLLNSPYFAAYLPLKDIDNNPVGMLFVGKPQIGVLQAAGRSIELTFLVIVILFILAVVPAYLIAKYLSNQLR